MNIISFVTAHETHNPQLSKPVIAKLQDMAKKNWLVRVTGKMYSARFALKEETLKGLSIVPYLPEDYAMLLEAGDGLAHRAAQLCDSAMNIVEPPKDKPLERRLKTINVYKSIMGDWPAGQNGPDHDQCARLVVYVATNRSDIWPPIIETMCEHITATYGIPLFTVRDEAGMSRFFRAVDAVMENDTRTSRSKQLA